MPAPSLFIATPWVRPHMGAYTRSLLQAVLPEYVDYKDPYGLPVDAGRNFIIESFKLSKADFLLFVDNDCGFTPNAIKRLMDYNLPMVSACMYTKDIPPRPTMGRFIGVDDKGKDYYSWAWAVREIIEFCRLHNTEKIEKNEYEFEPTDNDLRKVDGCGMHFTLIRRDVIEAIKPPYFVMLGKSGAGEDFYFSKKVIEAGFPIYFDVGLHTAHYPGEEQSYGLRELLLISKYIPIEGILEDGPFVMGDEQ